MQLWPWKITREVSLDLSQIFHGQKFPAILYLFSSDASNRQFCDGVSCLRMHSTCLIVITSSLWCVWKDGSLGVRKYQLQQQLPHQHANIIINNLHWTFACFHGSIRDEHVRYLQIIHGQSTFAPCHLCNCAVTHVSPLKTCTWTSFYQLG